VIATSTNPLQIGGDSLYGQFFQGTIDEVRIYSVVLTAAQIQTDMNTPIIAAQDTQPPTEPTNLVATAVGGTQIELNWIASTDNVGVTGYLVERQDPGNAGFAYVTTVLGTTFFDTGLTGPTNYSYRVRATDAAGNLSPYSPVASATTPPYAVASDNFNRPNGPLGGNWSKPSVSSNNLFIVNDQVGVDVENSHNYAFWSANNFDDEQYSQAQITTIGPWTGVILRADSIQDRFYIGFVFGPNDYRIYSRWDGAYYSLATGSSVTWQVGDILRLEVNGTVDPITITMYRNGVEVLSWVSTGSGQVRTGGSPGLGIYSPTGMGLTMDNWEGGNLAPDTQSPSVPTNLVASAVGDSQINLNWIASTDNVGVTGYLVERSQGAGSTAFTQIGTASGTTYSDTGLTATTTCNYRVRATDAAGNLSGYSVVATAMTPATASGLVAAYSFNEGTGTVVTDASGNGNNGTISGATWTTSGKYGNALVFNGTSALVTVNNSTTLQLSNAMTLEAWVNPLTVNSAWRDVVYRSSDNYYLEGTTASGSVPGTGGTFGTSDVVLYGSTALPVNTWTHLAATYDGTMMRLYVNGTQVASQPQTGVIATSTNPLQIGGDSLYGQFFQGTIDEVRIYNVVLTAAEIQTDMNTPVEP
jgi:chitodextrinase